MTKKNKFFAVSASAALVASAILPVAASASEFKDNADIAAYAAPYVASLVDAEIMQGNNGNFNPKGNLTRAEAAVMFTKAFGLEATGEKSFSDVPASAWYSKFVLATADNNLVAGYENGTFAPQKNITRAEAAVMIVKALDLPKQENADLSAFADGDQVPAWAAGWLAVAAELEIIKGREANGKLFLDFGKNITRQDFAVMFQKTAVEAEILEPVVKETELTAALKELVTAEQAVKAITEVTAENLEATKTAIATLEEAIATVEAFKSDAQEVKVAVEAAKTTLAAAQEKVDAFEGVAKVASVKAINETTIEVALAKDFKTTEADLVGKKITLTAGETTLTAEYSEKSLDKDGKAIFTLAANTKLVDATEYTVAADWAKFVEPTFVAQTKAPVLSTFTKVTEAVPATLKDVTSPEAKIAVIGQDQYGKEIAVSTAVTVKATINGLPITATYADGFVVVTNKLVEGDVLKFTLETTVDQQTVKSDFEYKIGAAEAKKVSTIDLQVKDNVLSVASGKDVEISAKGYDQFKTPVAASELTWVVNGKIVESPVNGVFTLNETIPGQYKVQVFAKEDSKVQAEVTITVGAAKLVEVKFNDSIKDVEGNAATLENVAVTSKDFFNKETLTLGTIEVNDGAALSATDVKFDVVAGKDLAAADIKVVAEEATTKEGKKVILVKATTTKAGEFKVTPFVGTDIKDEKAVKVASPITVSTTINPEVAAISNIAFDTKEFKVGATPKAQVTFTNKHGEVLTAEDVKTQVTVTSSKSTVASGSIKQGSKDVTGEDVNKTYLQLSQLTEGTAILTVQAGKVVKTVQVDVVKPLLTTIKAENSKVTGVKAGDTSEKAAKYNAISFLDQDGKVMDPGTVALSVKNAKGETINNFATVGEMTVDKETEAVSFNETGAKTHVQLAPASTVEKGTYTVTVSAKDAAGKDITSTFQVVVDAARAIDKVTVSPEASTLVKGATTTLNINTVDQYGEFIAVGTTAISKALSKDGVVTVSDVKEVFAKDKDGKTTSEVIGYTADVTAVAEGEADVTINVVKDAKVLATTKQTIKVGAVADVISSVAIKQVTGIQNSASTEGIELEAIVKDANQNVVEVTDKELTWSITGVKDAAGNKLNGTFNASTGVYTIAADATKGIKEAIEIKIVDGVITTVQGSLGELVVDVAVKVETVTFKTAETTVKMTDSAPTYKSGFAIDTATTASGEEVKFTTGATSFEVTEKDGLVFTFSGVDQYGEDFAIVEGVKAVSGSSDVVVTVSEDKAEGVAAQTLTVKVSEAGKSGKVYVSFGNERVELSITSAGTLK